ncbi:MAG: ComEC/Rec2 family competence protein [Synergistaceae bacterium]
MLHGKNVPIFISETVAFLLFTFFILGGTPSIKKGFPSVFLISVIISLLLSTFIILRMNDYHLNGDANIEIDGKIVSVKDWKWRWASIVSTDRGKFVIYTHKRDSFTPLGFSVKINGSLKELKRINRRDRTNNKFDEYVYWRSKGVKGEIVVNVLKRLSPPSLFYRVRSNLERMIKEELPPNMSLYVQALILGNRDKKIASVNKRTGTIHLLAVSGFHVAILVALLSLILKKGKRRIIIVSSLMWLYIALSGFSPGGVRAAFMMQIYLLGAFLGEPNNAFNGISIASIIMLLHNPWIFFDIGWQLSVSSALFICAISHVSKKLFAKTIILTVLVWFMSISLVLYNFGESYLTGIFMNIFAIPIFSILFPIMLLSTPLIILKIPLISTFLSTPIENSLDLWEWISEVVIVIFPYKLQLTVPLLTLSIFLFFIACSFGSGIKIKRAFIISSLFTILMLCFICV